MPRFRKIIFGLVSVVLVLLATVLMSPGFDDFDLSEYPQHPILFRTDFGQMSGTLILPAKAHSGPIVIFVHGDGPQDRFSFQGYLPIMSALLDKGIGVFSWDKPGVGESTGNWLEQSMQDRANEALAAYSAIRSARAQFDNSTGFLGFSQAGWVLPKVAKQLGTDGFYVIIGGATNWQQQGAYYTTKRLEAEGYSADYIGKYIQQQDAFDETAFRQPLNYERYLQQTVSDMPMSRDRFGFVARNLGSDSTDELAYMSAPTLAIFGKDDLNVDAIYEASVYQKYLTSRHPQSRVILWPNATHGLLRARWYNYQLASQWPWHTNVGALLAGRYIFAPGAIDHVSNWIIAR